MPANHARNVALTPELNAYVDELVASGDYANASEVLRAGLRALKRSQTQDEIATRLSLALDQLDAGEAMESDPNSFVSEALAAARARAGT